MARASVATNCAASSGGRGVPANFFARLPPSTNEFETQEGPAIALDNLINLDNVGMLQAGHGFGLDVKAAHLRVQDVGGA
jgi:hypothetical protein